MKAVGHVVVVGAGIGGLVAAALLAREGQAVTVLERGQHPGGKLRTQDVGGRGIDAGPTVFTLRPLFDALFERLGTRLDRQLQLRPLDTLARHVWPDGSRLDLHAGLQATVDAIGDFAGASQARAYRRFAARAKQIFDTLDHAFMRAPRPTPWSLAAGMGWRALPGLARISPFARLWPALQRQFDDPRLQQLFGRYATYCGSSPFQAPATLMLVAHAEQAGVWSVDGGMARVATALADLAIHWGAELRCATPVASLVVHGQQVRGVVLADGERIDADAVVFNGDTSALAQGLLGDAARPAVPAHDPRRRSLSAVTWALRARTSGLALARHTVFFGPDYRQEFDDILDRGRLPRAPTVYVCAQDREGTAPPDATERLLCLVNAPANADGAGLTPEEIDRCEQISFEHLARCGLQLAAGPHPVQRTTPADFHQLFPGTGGALYGQATHGWRSSFSRPGSRSGLQGLYLTGGSVHPGPGVPMAAWSGLLAADALMQDRASRTSTSGWRATAMPGGTSTR